MTTGEPAPELSADYVTGEGPKTLAEARGKVVVVDFWATFCDPCARSFPKYEELVRQFGGNLAVLAVSLDARDETTRTALLNFATRHEVRFPILWDEGSATRNAYRPRDLPTSYIIDKRGVVRFVHAKYEGGDEEKMEAEIRALLAE